MTNPPGQNPPPPPPGGPYGDDEDRGDRPEEGAQQSGQDPYDQQPGQEPYGQPPEQGGYGAPAQGQGPYGQQGGWGQPGAYGQPGYPAGGGYGAPGAGSEQDNKLGVWALVTGILGFCCGPIGIAAIILGKKSKDAAARGTATNGGLGQAGFILGIIVLALWVLGLVVNLAIGGFNYGGTGY